MMLVGFFQGATADFSNSGSKPHGRVTAGGLLEKSAIVHTVPEQCVSVDGNSLGLPNLGHIYAPAEVLAHVTGLKAELDPLLRPGETYLDLTNRQANYFYLGLPSPVSYGAPWFAGNTALQDRLLAEIKSRPPPVVWLAPGLLYGPETAAVHLYKLYRFLAQEYVPFSHNGYVFLIAPERFSDRNLTPQNGIRILREVLGGEDLGWLPSAWGLSWSRLEGHFAEVQKLSVPDAPITDGTGVSLQSSENHYSGERSDFVKLDFWSNLNPSNRMTIEISWTSEHGAGSARLFAANGTNLVPLGAIPDWLLARNISDLKLTPLRAPEGLKYTIRSVELLRLKE
jgi:hypothetical protein